MSSEEIEYRGYFLTVVFLSPQWQVGIFPSQPDSPRLPASEPRRAAPRTIRRLCVHGCVSTIY